MSPNQEPEPEDDIDLTPPKHIDCYHRQMIEAIDIEQETLHVKHKQARWPIPFQHDVI